MLLPRRPALAPTALLLAAPLLATLLLAPGGAAQLSVVSITPRNNATAAPTATPIEVTLSQAVDRASVGAATFRVFGRWSGVVPGAFGFSNGDRTVTFRPARPFFPGETVSVGLSSGVTAAAGGGALARGFVAWFWTRPAAGSGSFTRVATLRPRRNGEGRIRIYGAYAGDLDGDGSADLSLVDEDSNDVRVWRNDGCGSFAGNVLHPLPAGSRPSPSEGADLNDDGVIDLALANTRGDSISILLGDGAGGYRPAVTYPSGGGTRGLALCDVDADGDVDAITANRNTSNLALHRNRGDGTFAPRTFFEGGGQTETAVAAADANGDGIADLFVGHYSSGTVTLLLGDGSGGFAVSATRSVQSGPWMIVAGDVDGDGNADAVTCNSGSASLSVVRGDGAGGLFAAVHRPTGSFPLAVDLGDLDGDGDLDVAVSNFSSASFTVYRNDGTGNLVAPFTLPASRAGSCMLVVDCDRDGDVDLVGLDELDDLVFIFDQDGPAVVGAQTPDCAATLRIDELGDRGGFGGRATHGVPAGGTFFIGFTAGADAAYAVFGGADQQLGTSMPFGLLNVAPATLTPLLFLQADGFGEGRTAVPLPPGVPVGAALTLQGIAADPGHPAGFRLSNPESVAVR